MARKNKGKIKSIKKLDASKYTPLELDRRGVSEKAQRKLYSDLRQTALKRIKRLKEAGYDWTPEAKHILPNLKQIDQYPSPTYALHNKLMEIVNFLNNPLSLVSNQKFRTEVKMANTLAKHGYTRAAQNPEQFGKFMEAVKSRSRGLEFDSERAVKYYETKKLKINMKDLADTYVEWQYNEDKRLIENVKKLHPNDYKEYLEMRGRDYDAIMESIEQYEKNTRSTNRKRK